MIHSFYWAVAENTVGAAILALAVFAITRFWKNPTVRHALWLLVLLKLVVPPLVSIPLIRTSAGSLPNSLPIAASSPVDRSAMEPRLDESSSAPRLGQVTRLADSPSSAPDRTVIKSWLHQIPLGVLVGVTWATVSSVWLAIAGVRIIRFHRAVNRAAAADSRISEMAAGVASRLGFRRPVEVRVSTGLFPPLLWAVGHARIVLPEFALTDLTPTQLEGILAHEIAHLVRRDHWVRWLDLGVFACYWWNPILWWARRELRVAEEQACDARVVRAYAGIDTSYVEALIAVIERVQTPSYPVPVLANPLGGEGTLKRRVAAIVDRPEWRMGKCGAAVVAVAAISLFCSVRSSADQAPPAPAAAPVDTAAVPPVEMLSKTVRVVDEQGEPIEGATVSPWAIRTTRGAHVGWGPARFGRSEPPTLTTDADGKATIPFPKFALPEEQIPPKDLTCTVQHHGYAQTNYNDVPVTPDELANITTIVLHAGAVVEVTALDGGRPLPLSRVHALWSSPSIDQEPKITAEGLLQLPRLPAGTELLRLVFIPEQGPLLISPVEMLELANGEPRTLRIEMQPSVRLAGRLDASVSRPVKNGRVVVEVIDRTEGQSLEWEDYALIREDGSFLIENLPAGEVEVIALCDGYIAESGTPPDSAKDQQINDGRPQVFPLHAAKNEIVVEMTPTASCRIKVLGPDERPVAAARCMFFPNVYWWGGGCRIYCSPLDSTAEMLRNPKAWQEARLKANEHLFAGTTDAAGIAVIQNLPSSESRLLIEDERFELPISDWNRSAKVELKAGKQTDLTVQVQARGTQFLGAGSLSQTAAPEQQSEPHGTDSAPSATTTNSAFGTPPEVQSGQDVRVEKEAAITAPVRLPATIEGKVVDQQNAPVAGAKVTARIDPIHSYPDPADPATPKPWTATTDDQGRYAFSTDGQTLGADDLLTVEIRADGFVDFSTSLDGRQAATGSLPVQRLPAGRRIQGRLVDPDGNPVTEAALRFIANTPDFTLLYSSAPQPVDRLGAFSVWIPKAGQAAFAIYPRGFAPRLVDVPPQAVDATDNGTDLGSLRVESGTSLTGRVLDRQGHGVAGTVVAIQGVERREIFLFSILIGTAVKTDEQGRFTLPPVVGSYRLWVTDGAPDYSRRFVLTGSKPPPILPQKIDFDTVGKTQELIFQEGKSVTVEGTVRWADGSAVPDVEVKSFMLPAGWETGTDLGSARTDAKGHYALKLPAPADRVSINIPMGIQAPDGSFRQFKPVGRHARQDWGLTFDVLADDVKGADFEVGPKQ